MLRYAATSILKKLARKPEMNAPLLNVAERNCHEDLKVIGNSIRIRDKLSGTHMFAADSWDGLEALLEEASGELDTFMVNTSEYGNEILRMFPGALTGEYNTYVMKKKDYLPCNLQLKGFETSSLDLDWMDFIMSNYKDMEFGNERYISDRILNGPGMGLLYQGRKVAFALQHKDGESGPLVVDMDFRGIGLGSELLMRFNRLLFERNSIIFGLVKSGNLASASMMVRSGYKKTKYNTLWVYRMKNGSLYLP